MRSLWRKLGFGLLAFGLAVGLFVLVEHMRGRCQLAREVASLKAKGEKLTVAELLSPAGPARQNGAEEMRRGAAGLGGSPQTYGLPSSRNLPPGKLNLATQLRQWPRFGGPPRSTNVITVREFIEEMQPLQPCFDLIHAAVRRPSLEFNTAYSLRRLNLVPGGMVYLSDCKKCGTWLRAASLCALLQGDHAGSLTNLESCALLARKLSEQRLLISQLVAIAIGHIGVQGTWEALQTPGWTDAQLASLQAAWAESDGRLPMLRALEMERAMTGEAYVEWTNSELFDCLAGWQTALAGGGSPPLAFPSSLEDVPEFFRALFEATARAAQRDLYIPLWRVAWAEQDKARFLHEWQTRIEAARQAAWSNSVPAVVETSSGDSEFGVPFGEQTLKRVGFYDRCRYFVSAQAFFSIAKAMDKASTFEAWRRMTVTAVALQRYRLSQGKLAPDLAALVPLYLPVVPVDPMDGRPLRYRLQTDGNFLLYSVGENGLDDGGDARSLSGDPSNSMLRGRDFVWPAVATKEEIEAADAKSKPSRRPSMPGPVR